MEEDVWVGDWVLFSLDTQSGIETWYNPKENLVKRISHVDGIVAANKTIQQQTSGKRWGDGKAVASIPLDVFHRELAPAIEQDDQKHIKRFLNDSDNRAWRTKEGTV